MLLVIAINRFLNTSDNLNQNKLHIIEIINENEFTIINLHIKKISF
jgi:hypothetical protein